MTGLDQGRRLAFATVSIFPAMSRSPSAATLAAAALFGVATGMRSFLPLAVLSLTHSRPRGLRLLLVPLATAELVRDKLPGTGSRLAPGRSASGSSPAGWARPG